MYLLELERSSLLLAVESPEILDDTVTVGVLQAEQRGVEHRVSLADKAQTDPGVQGLLDDRTMSLWNLALFLVQRLLVVNPVTVVRKSWIKSGRALEYGREL